MKPLVLMILAILVPLPAAPPQEERELKYVDPDYVYGDEAKQLLKALAPSPQIPISFENVDRSPLAIVGGSISTVERRQPDVSTVATVVESEYAVSERINVVNRTDRRIRGATLEFTDVSLRMRFNLSARVAVEPYGSSVFGELRDDAPVLTALRMRPGQLSVKVLEVRFEDGAIWVVDSPDVDEAPVPLTRAEARQTEEALRNRIQGPLRMRLLVGGDGKVKQVKIIRGLPDGLNEQALQQAYSLKFKPAMRAGQPVDVWLLFEIEYNLPLTRRSTSKGDEQRR